MRTALEAGRPADAISALNRELGVASGDELPKKLRGDNALLVLDRASLHQAVASFARSKRDFEAADKALDVLDLSHGTADADRAPLPSPPTAAVNGKPVPLEVGLDVAGLVRAHWSKIEGQVMAAALSRAIARARAAIARARRRPRRGSLGRARSSRLAA